MRSVSARLFAVFAFITFAALPATARVQSNPAPPPSLAPANNLSDLLSPITALGNLFAEPKLGRNVLDDMPPSVSSQVEQGTYTQDLSSYINTSLSKCNGVPGQKATLVFGRGPFPYANPLNLSTSNCKLVFRGTQFVALSSNGSTQVVNAGVGLNISGNLNQVSGFTLNGGGYGPATGGAFGINLTGNDNEVDDPDIWNTDGSAISDTGLRNRVLRPVCHNIIFGGCVTHGGAIGSLTDGMVSYGTNNEAVTLDNGSAFGAVTHSFGYSAGTVANPNHPPGCFGTFAGGAQSNHNLFSYDHSFTSGCNDFAVQGLGTQIVHNTSDGKAAGKCVYLQQATPGSNLALAGHENEIGFNVVDYNDCPGTGVQIQVDPQVPNVIVGKHNTFPNGGTISNPSNSFYLDQAQTTATAANSGNTVPIAWVQGIVGGNTQLVTGTGIPAGTTVASVTSSTNPAGSANAGTTYGSGSVTLTPPNGGTINVAAGATLTFQPLNHVLNDGEKKLELTGTQDLHLILPPPSNAGDQRSIYNNSSIPWVLTNQNAGAFLGGAPSTTIPAYTNALFDADGYAWRATVQNPACLLTGCTMTGQLVSTASGGGKTSPVLVKSGSAALGLYNTSAGTDLGVWDFLPQGPNLTLRAVNDANSAAANWAIIYRAAPSPAGGTPIITGIQFPEDVQAGGAGVTGSSLSVSNSAATCTHTATTASETVSCSSDARLKSRIRDARSALRWLDSFHVREFDTRSDGSHHTGVIAQELQITHPELVHVLEQKGGEVLSAEQPDSWRTLKALQDVYWMVKLLLIWNAILSATVVGLFVLRRRTAMA